MGGFIFAGRQRSARSEPSVPPPGVLSRNAVTANRRTSQVTPADWDSEDGDGGGMGHLRSSKPPSLPMPSPAHIKQLLKREESAKKLSGAGGKALV